MKVDRDAPAWTLARHPKRIQYAVLTVLWELKFLFLIMLTAVTPLATLESTLRHSYRRKKVMRKVLSIILLGIGAGVAAMAATPEIDPASAGSALALLAGTLLVIRGRRRK